MCDNFELPRKSTDKKSTLIGHLTDLVKELQLLINTFVQEGQCVGALVDRSNCVVNCVGVFHFKRLSDSST